jgi:nitroimidazol reductase NimA-like FMN-containing flavoprotein (pyridoxamine 5'-phosphate oxidase superfamily)
VNFLLQDHGIVFRTAQGTKLASLTVDSRVAFEIDGVDERSGIAWSVVARGTAEVLDADDIPVEGAEQVTSWHRAPKPLIVRISVGSLTGRRFVAE